MLLYLEFLPSVLIGMARIYPCAFLVAAFCFQHIRGMPRHTIVMVMALLPAPGIHAVLTSEDYSMLVLVLVALMLKEAALGFLLGILLAMPFWMFESVGALLDNQRGALAGGQLNPSLGPDATPIGHLFKQLAIFLLISSLGLGALTQVIWDSYLIWPPTAWFPMPMANGMGVFMTLLSDTFTHMMLYAAPFIAVLLFLEFSFALLGVYSQQLQVSTLAPPIKSLAGIGVLLLYFTLLQDLIVGRMSLLGDLKHVFGLLFKVAGP